MGDGIIMTAVAPHPPIIVPEVGGREVDNAAATVRGMRELAARISAASPDTLIVITPHGPVLRDTIVISGLQPLKGSLAQFSAPGAAVEMENDLELVRVIAEESRKRGISCAVAERGMGGIDHGALVPLYFLAKAGLRSRLVSITMAMLPRAGLFEFGRSIRAACESAGRRCALLASGDLSHRLMRGAPAGYSPRGKEFDRIIVDALRSGDANAVLSLDEDLADEAGECGLRPIIIMFGALDGLEYEPEVLSYEGPFGVGYATAVFEVSGEGEDPYVGLARLSLETFVREKRFADRPTRIPPGMKRRAGAFVSLHESGRLRGCIGTIVAREKDLASEIMRNAISAGVEDPRFDPVTPGELDALDYSVDVLSEPEEVPDEGSLDPRKYGVIVQKGHRQGLLLPDLEGVDTVDAQVSIAKQKAGLRPDETGVRLFRFTVERHHSGRPVGET
ncbi:MAG: AmmeMemoRadiSam system protein A [Bacillota bacterium]